MNPARRRRGQHGFTLIEVLLAVTISSLVAVPVLAWSVFGFNENIRTQRRNEDATTAAILSTYFSRDIQTATFVGTDTDCPGGGGASIVGDPVHRLLVTATFDGDTRVAYTLAPTIAGQAPLSIWRRTCKVNPAVGDVTGSTPLADGIGSGALVTFACAADATNPTCGTATLTFPRRSGGTITLSAAKRAGAPWPPLSGP